MFGDSKLGVCAQAARLWSGAARLLLLSCTVVLFGCEGTIFELPSKSDALDGGAVPAAGPDAGAHASVDENPCPLGQTPCDGRCFDLSANALHCGSCGVVCDSSQYCAEGRCTALCAAGQVDCGGVCTAVQSDPRACGDCGRACAPGEFCNGGVCSTTCSYEICETPAGLECADTRTNARHCGGCGAACPASMSCVDGHCELQCPEGRSGCGGACVDTATDPGHCGVCDRVCPDAVACIAGGCGCPPGQALCDGACVDVVDNPEHCGTCSNTCDTGAACVSSTCVCPAGQVPCSGVCTDLSASVAHCGACGQGCDSLEICDIGTCVPESVGCSGGRTLCEETCVDTLSSSSHCGQCNRPCPPSQSCVGGICECPNGGTLCGTSCVDIGTSNTHCGACDAPCTGGRSCVSGSCACAADEAFCDGACVVTLDSPDHCGGCNSPCEGSRTCVNGNCICPTGLEWCEAACVDPLTDGNHCGGCGAACTGGAVCTDGSCACPQGQTACDGQCIDIQTSLSHCGGCGQPCFAGEVCSAGRCQGPLGADGCGTLARDLTVREIAAYQSLKIPIMSSLQEIPAGDRIADVVQGRQTMFRVFVDVAPGFAPRELSARLTLVSDGTEDQYFEKRVISGSSTETSTSSTFQIFVPPDKITSGTRYSVEIVECDTASGALGAPRFPESSDVALGVRETGPLRVTIVPVYTNSRLPDTSDSALAVYEEYLEAMYPVTDVELSVTSQITTSYPINWSNLLSQVRDKRQSESPSSDVYYYGFVKPTDTISQYCQFTCTAGVGYVAGASQSQGRAAVGLAYGGESSASTMAHEVGHNHGRNHAPCAPGGSEIVGLDPYYPYSGASLGSWGYDPRSRVLIAPDDGTDIMAYCSNKWVSDYTYRGFTDRVATLNGAFLQVTDPAYVLAYRTLLLDAQGPRWGLPYVRPAEPFGDPEQAEVLDSAGAVVARVTVFRSAIGDIDAETVLVPPPEPRWHAVRVIGAPAHPFSAPVTVAKP